MNPKLNLERSAFRDFRPRRCSVRGRQPQILLPYKNTCPRAVNTLSGRWYADFLNVLRWFHAAQVFPFMQGRPPRRTDPPWAGP